MRALCTSDLLPAILRYTPHFKNEYTHHARACVRKSHTRAHTRTHSLNWRSRAGNSYQEIERARSVYEQFFACHPKVYTSLKNEYTHNALACVRKAQIHTYTNTHIYKHTHTHAHTYTNTHIHMHTRMHLTCAIRRSSVRVLCTSDLLPVIQILLMIPLTLILAHNNISISLSLATYVN